MDKTPTRPELSKFFLSVVKGLWEYVIWIGYSDQLKEYEMKRKVDYKDDRTEADLSFWPGV